jgi:hypothetical protein
MQTWDRVLVVDCGEFNGPGLKPGSLVALFSGLKAAAPSIETNYDRAATADSGRE